MISITFPSAIAASIERETLLSQVSLSDAALAVRRALLSQLSPSALASKLAFIENSPSPSQLVPTIDVALTNWSKYRFAGGSELDFGWGAPTAASPGAVAFPPGTIHIMEHGGQGDLRVTVSVEREAGESFQGDEEFWTYARRLD
jgi:hypothetical protein